MTDRIDYIENAITTLEKLQAEIERFEAEEGERRAARKEIKRLERNKLLRQKLAAAEECIKHLQQANDESSETAKAAFETTLDDLKASMERARHR
jgi:CCR4-NOT transcriptional regulation complex NOT5 subunit